MTTDATHPSRSNMLAALAVLGLGLGVYLPAAKAGPRAQTVDNAGEHPPVRILKRGMPKEHGRPGARSYKLEDSHIKDRLLRKRPGARSYKVEAPNPGDR